MLDRGAYTRRILEYMIRHKFEVNVYYSGDPIDYNMERRAIRGLITTLLVLEIIE